MDVVLVRPARAANVAAAARALKNMGLGTLVLVDPPPGLDTVEARNLAYGAWDVLDAARRAPALADAVAGCTLVAVTSGRAADGAVTPRAFAGRAAGMAGGGRVAVVFGPEASGLTADELRAADLRVRVPTDDAHPSLNLAQAVLILAYELRLAHLAGGAAAGASAPPLASAGELEEAFGAIGRALVTLGYLNAQNPGPVLAELRALVARARPTAREAALLRGLGRQLAWAARSVARGGRAADNPGPRRRS